MKNSIRFGKPRGWLVFAACWVGVMLLGRQSQAYPYYSDPVTGVGNCSACHGDFRGPTSPKGTVFPSNNNHEMHRAATSMSTACNLCHSGASRFPVELAISTGTANNTGVGCAGCHMAEGLRKHHWVNGITECLTCHLTDGPPPAENVKPPYYGTADTRAKNPGNDVLAANTNENWSIGDFLGLDNDGNNLYDQADYAVGPFKILSGGVEGNDFRLTWLTAGGRTNTLQTAASLTGSYSNLTAALGVPGVGLVTNTYLHVGGATNSARFYRLNAQVP